MLVRARLRKRPAPPAELLRRTRESAFVVPLAKADQAEPPERTCLRDEGWANAAILRQRELLQSVETTSVQEEQQLH